MLIKKVYILIGILIVVICAIRFLSLRSDVSDKPLKIYKTTTPTKTSDTAEVQDGGDTSPGGHFHADGAWHSMPLNEGSEMQGLPSVISHGAERQKTSEPEKQNAPPFISYAQYRRDHKAWREKFKKAHTEWDQAMQDFLNASVEFRETLSDTEREQAMATLREAHEKRQAASEKLESLRQEEPVPPTPPQNN